MTPSPWHEHTGTGSVWVFDLDGTLIGSVRSTVRRPGATELLTALAGRGVCCVLWSAGGAEYARRMAVHHGLDAHIDAFYTKGERRQRRYVTAHFDADHQPHVFVDDSPADLPSEALIVPVPEFIGGNSADRTLWSLLEAL